MSVLCLSYHAKAAFLVFATQLKSKPSVCAELLTAQPSCYLQVIPTKQMDFGNRVMLVTKISSFLYYIVVAAFDLLLQIINFAGY